MEALLTKPTRMNSDLKLSTRKPKDRELLKLQISSAIANIKVGRYIF